MVMMDCPRIDRGMIVMGRDLRILLAGGRLVLIEERALVKTYSNGKNGARENLEGGLDECKGSVSTERCVKKWNFFCAVFCLLVRWRMTTFLFALPQTLFFGLRR
jgi:hypothetical protein